MNDTRKRRPTLQDIADLTGVTKMTVSRYLRDPSAVAEGTRERIAAAVEELGYIPNRAPDMLSNATSKASRVAEFSALSLSGRLTVRRRMLPWSLMARGESVMLTSMNAGNCGWN